MNRQTSLTIVLAAALLGSASLHYTQHGEIAALNDALNGLRASTGKLPGAYDSAGGLTPDRKSSRLTTTDTPRDASLKGTAADATGAGSPRFDPDLSTGFRPATITPVPFNISGLGGAAVPQPLTEPMTLEQAEEIVRSRPVVAGKGPSWSHHQVTGAPDTVEAGDIPTAWAPRNTRSGEQWLQVGYDKSVEISGINVHETYNPGALSRVTAIMPDGSEREIWSGTAPSGEAPVETAIPVPSGITSDKIRLYVDTNRVASWPEIDAVEMIGADGSRQWASSSTASSFYGDPPSLVGSQAFQTNHNDTLGFRLTERVQ